MWTVNDQSEDMAEYRMVAYDEKSGEMLAPTSVGTVRAISLYDEAPTSERYMETGKPPVNTKWVNLNKRTTEEPEVRCRLVAKDFKSRGEEERG